MNVLILHGTETGTAEMLAEEMAGWFDAQDGAGHASLADVTPSDLEAGTAYLIVCSTYGDGELPGTAKSFYALLDGGTDLSGVKFAIFGLGDSQYQDTFGFGSKLIEDAMIAAGAQTLVDRHVHDASGSDLAEDAAKIWIETVKDRLHSTS